MITVTHDAQRELLSREVTTGKALPRQVARARWRFDQSTARVAAEAAKSRKSHRLRGAFVVFNTAQLADNVLNSAPTGAERHCVSSRLVQPMLWRGERQAESRESAGGLERDSYIRR